MVKATAFWVAFISLLQELKRNVRNRCESFAAMPGSRLKSSGNITHTQESGIEGVHIFEQGQHGAPKLELLGQKGFLPLSCRW